MATSELFRFLAFDCRSGDSLACGNQIDIVKNCFVHEGGDLAKCEILEFKDSAGSHAWEQFLPLHVARDTGETVWRSEP